MKNRRRDDSTPKQPDTDEQSGSAGRKTENPQVGYGKDSGQDRYGQSGLGGTVDRETAGQSAYRRSGAKGAPKSRSQSNAGSGKADPESRRKGPR